MKYLAYYKLQLTFLAIILLCLQAISFAVFATDRGFVDFQKVSEVKDAQLKQLNRLALNVIELPKNGLLIVETTTDRIQPYFTRSIYELNNINTIVQESSATATPSSNLVDKDLRTSTRFDFDKSVGYSFITLKLDYAISTTNLSFYLDSNVQNPEEIAIQAKDSKQSATFQTVISRRENASTSISFPETFADTFKIEFFHRQPLRIQEIEIGKPTEKILTNQIIWLGRPNEKYVIFTDAQKPSYIQTEEVGDLFNIEDTIIITTLEKSSANPNFKEIDIDQDGIVDRIDNCPYIKNSDQKDSDKNGKGDICEDKDGDSILDGIDNCPQFANRNQIDLDTNSVGDICEDKDNDKIPNNIDNCPEIANPDQKDTDQDKIGYVCDTNGESRWLQNNQVINGSILVFGFAMISVLSYLTIRKKK